jgi:hypothetical protein
MQRIIDLSYRAVMMTVPWLITAKIILTASGRPSIDWFDAPFILFYIFIARERNPNF